MTEKKIVDIVLRILGINDCPKRTKAELIAFFELFSQEGVKSYKNTQKEPNEIKPEENTINLADAYHFRFPEEFNLQVEGEEGIRKIKIFPDGISETEPEKEEEKPVMSAGAN